MSGVITVALRAFGWSFRAAFRVCVAAFVMEFKFKGPAINPKLLPEWDWIEAATFNVVSAIRSRHGHGRMPF